MLVHVVRKADKKGEIVGFCSTSILQSKDPILPLGPAIIMGSLKLLGFVQPALASILGFVLSLFLAQKNSLCFSLFRPVFILKKPWPNL